MSVEQLRQKGLALYMSGQAEQALPYFDEALAGQPDEATRDLLIVNKASAQLSLKLSTPEIQELPQIMMRRPELRGLAAYHLATKFENDQDYKRARFYLELALRTAEEQGDDRLKAVTLVDLGNVCGYDSRFEDAIEYFNAALEVTRSHGYELWRAFATGNLGYCLIDKGEPSAGAELIHEAIKLFEKCDGDAYISEGLIDLCLAYLELNELDTAREYGQRGLDRASEPRQIRNAHYLLGEIAYKAGDMEAATNHFEKLGTYYPEFPQLTNLLFALDLRKMVNFKL